MTYQIPACPPPTLHLNGSGARNLLDQRGRVLEALRALDDALADAIPHDRDYYPQGPEAGQRARAAWLERRLLIDNLKLQTLQEYQAIYNDATVRRRL